MGWASGLIGRLRFIRGTGISTNAVSGYMNIHNIYINNKNNNTITTTTQHTLYNTGLTLHVNIDIIIIIDL